MTAIGGCGGWGWVYGRWGFRRVSKFAMGNIRRGQTVNSTITPFSTVLHEKLAGFQLVEEFPAFYATRRFMTAFTSAKHLSLF